MLTVKIYHEGKLKETFTDQKNDACALGYLHRATSVSADRAIRVEGWQVELIDQETGESEFWKPYQRIER